MARTVGIGIQNFEEIRKNNCFYIDKTFFIKEWWERYDSTTLITRPRRFGKTLNMSMVETFFSLDYAGRGIYMRDLRFGKKRSIGSYRELTRLLVCLLRILKRIIMKLQKKKYVKL